MLSSKKVKVDKWAYSLDTAYQTKHMGKVETRIETTISVIYTILNLGSIFLTAKKVKKINCRTIVSSL